MVKSLFIFLSFLFLNACATQGQYFPSDLKWIKTNTTKESDVRMLLGDPQSVGNSSGIPTWTYGYYRYKLFGKSQVKELKFYWNTDRTVQSFNFNSSFAEDISSVQKSSTPAVAPTQNGNGAKTSAPIGGQ